MILLQVELINLKLCCHLEPMRNGNIFSFKNKDGKIKTSQRANLSTDAKEWPKYLFLSQSRWHLKVERQIKSYLIPTLAA